VKNQLLQGAPTSSRFAACPSTVKSGDLVLLGQIPACALNDYQANQGGATFYTGGTFSGTVYASSSHSPITGTAINIGDKLYASGTLDSNTNVTTGLWISADSSDTPFGNVDPQLGSAMTSGSTNTAQAIRIGGAS